MKNYAVVMPSREHAALESYDFPSEPEGDQVLIKTDYSAISAGTEIANWHGLPNTNDRGDVWPRYTGYSSVGHVVKAGPEVKELALGDHVLVTWGGHRAYFMEHEKHVFKFDSALDEREVAFANIVTFAFLGVRKLNLQLGECAMIAGLGLLGVFAVQLAGLSGAYPVIAADFSPERRKLALELGADFVFDPGEPDFIAKVRAVSGGNGPDGVVEVTGSIIALQQALEYIAWEGRITLLGCTRVSDRTIDYYKYVHRRGITLIGCHTATRPAFESRPGKWTQKDDIAVFLKFLAAKKFRVLPVISREVSPRDAAEVYAAIGNSGNPPLGNVFDWRDIE